MYFRHHWDVLVVDDEPDMLSITRLALKNLTVLGVPLKIHECTSKEDAIRLLGSRAQQKGGLSGALPSGTAGGNIAIALIDVVMESEQAGLEICAFIREELKNRAMQLVIRTGQAGVAPEREVADRFDINGYLAKGDASQERLYVTVKNGIRQFLWSVSSHAMFAWSTQLVESSETRKALGKALKLVVAAPVTENVEGHVAVFIDGQVFGIGDYADVEKAKAVRQSLEGERSAVTDTGDLLSRRGHEVLLKLAPSAGLPQVEWVSRTNYDPMPDLFPFVQLLRCLRQLWVRAS